LFASANEDYADRPEPLEIVEAVRLTHDQARTLSD